MLNNVVYKYNGSPVTRMNLEDIMLSEVTQSKRQTLVRLHLYVVSTGDRFTQTERRVVTRG